MGGTTNDTLMLREPDRQKLDGIVQKMVSNKESDQNIQMVVNDFKQKYGKKKEQNTVSGVSPSVTTPTSTQTEPVTTTSDSEKKVGQKFKNNNVSPDDVGKTNGDRITPQLVSELINNKGKNLSFAQNVPSNNSSQYLVRQKQEVDRQISSLEQMPMSVSEYGQDAINAHKQKIDQLKQRSEYLNGEIQKNYDYRLRTLVPELSDQIKPTLTDADFNPETHTLRPSAVQRIAGIVDANLNKSGESVIDARVSGDLNKKNRTYEDVTRQVVASLNTIPIQKAQQQYTKDFAKDHPQIEAALHANEATHDYFSNTNFDEVKAKVKTQADKSFIEIKDKYWGKNGLFMNNKDMIAIQEKYAQLVHDGKMTEDVAKKQIDAEVQGNPALTKIQKNYEGEVRKITENASKQYEQYLIKGLQQKHPEYTIYGDGSVGLAGMSEQDYKKLLQEYKSGAEKVGEKFGTESNEAWKNIANQKAVNAGAFWGSLGMSANSLMEGLNKWWFNKTGWGGDKVRHFEAQDIASPQISESDQAASWNWKGIESLVNPNFYLSGIGQNIPVIAGAAAIGATTRGAGLPEYVEWLASAGLFTGQASLQTYNQLLTTRDKDGNMLSEADASHYAADQARKDFLPNVVMMALGSGTLIKAKNIVQPTVIGTLGKSLRDVAATQPLFAWQGFNSYSALKEAQGQQTDIFDYMQSKEFRDNLVNGLVLGGSFSLIHAPTNFMKSMDGWTRLVHTSPETEFKNGLSYNYALGQEMLGNGDYLRDALKLHVFNTDPEGLNAEGKKQLADLKNSLLYSTNLDKNIKAGNLDKTNINDLYQAHNLALADQHDYLAEQTAKDGNKSLSDIYKDKAKEYREEAKLASNGDSKYRYLVNAEGQPIFLSGKSFDNLQASGKIREWLNDGTIKDVARQGDPEFSERYKEYVAAQNESSIEGKDILDHAADLIEQNKETLGPFYFQAKANPEGFLNEVSDAVKENEEKAREQYGDNIVDISKVLYPKEEKNIDYSPPVSEKGKDAIREANDRKQEIDKAGFHFLTQEDDGGFYNKKRKYDPDEVPIGMVGIKLEEQGKGLGTLGYILKGEEYLKQGKHLVSDIPDFPESRTEQAEGVWKKLVKLGLATETRAGNYRYGGERENINSQKKEGGSYAGQVRENQSELREVGQTLGTEVQTDRGSHVQQTAETGTETSNEKNKITPEDNITVSEMLDKTGIYKGQRGMFAQDGQTVIFKTADGKREYELGNVNEIGNKGIHEFGIDQEKSVVDINDKGNIIVRGKEYENRYSNPLQALNYDKEGNLVSVTLTSPDGGNRTFRGPVGEDIAYQITLKQISNEQLAFEQFLNEDDAVRKEMDDAGISAPSEEAATKNNEPVQKEKIEPVKNISSPKTESHEDEKTEEAQGAEGHEGEQGNERNEMNPEGEPAKETPPGPPTSKDEWPFIEPNKTGIAARIKKEREFDAGVESPKPGTRLSKQELIDLGRKLLSEGRDPEKIMQNFENDPEKNISTNAMALSVAHLEQLAKATDRAKEEFGEDSKEANFAKREEAEWEARVQPMQAVWSEIGVTQQAATEVETGTLTGFKRSFQEQVGRPMTSEEAEKAKDLVDRIKELTEKEQKLRSKVKELTSISPEEKEQRSIKERAKKTAQKIREKAKLNRPGMFMAATPASLVWDGAVEIVAKTIETGGALADAVGRAIEHIKASDWYKGLSKEKQDRAVKEFSEFHSEEPEVLTPEEKKIKRLEKELEGLKNGIAKQKSPKSEDSDRAKELKEQIKDEKGKLGLNPSKHEKPLTPDEQREQNDHRAQKLAEKFAGKKDNKFTEDEAKDVWGHLSENYLDKGVDVPTAVQNTSIDMGMSVEQVLNAMATPKGGKELSDEMWNIQSEKRKALNSARYIVADAQKSGLMKALDKVPSVFFTIKTYGHGTVGNITHAGPNIFRPSTWAAYWPNVFKSFGLAYGSKANYERSIFILKNKPNFATWIKDGLAADPERIYDEYQLMAKPQKKTSLGRGIQWLTDTGTRGFAGLNFMRYDLAEMLYNRASEAAKADPEFRKQVAELVNHATGHSEVFQNSGKIGKALRVVSFAPGLEVSRWQRTITDPGKAAITFGKWISGKEVSPSDIASAKITAQSAGEKIALYSVLLAANAGLLHALGSKQKVNWHDPTQSDWMKFKFNNKTLDVSGNALSPYRLLYTLTSFAYKANFGRKKDVQRKPGDQESKETMKQLRYKASPMVSDAADIYSGTDAMGNVLPWSKVKPQKGAHKLTWDELIGQEVFPIPVQAGIEAYHDAMEKKGMSKSMINGIMNGILLFGIEGATGAKYQDDYSLQKKK